MTKTYDLNDDGVVVIIGSGAGGGSLGHELATRGIDVVMLVRAPIRTSMTSGAPSFSLRGSIPGRPAVAGALPRTFPAFLPGSARRSVGARPTGQVHPFAFRSMSGVSFLNMARSRAQACSIGRSQQPTWTPITPKPRTSSV